MQELERLLNARAIPTTDTYFHVVRALVHLLADKGTLVKQAAMKGIEAAAATGPWSRLDLDLWQAQLQMHAESLAAKQQATKMLGTPGQPGA